MSVKESPPTPASRSRTVMACITATFYSSSVRGNEFAAYAHLRAGGRFTRRACGQRGFRSPNSPGGPVTGSDDPLSRVENIPAGRARHPGDGETVCSQIWLRNGELWGKSVV